LARISKFCIYLINGYIQYRQKIYIFARKYDLKQKLITKITVRKLETLQIQPLKDKKLTVLMVEKEYNEPFWLIEPTNKSTSDLSVLHKPSIALTSFLEKLIKKIKPDFATEELGLRSLEEFNESNDISKLFKRNEIPFHPVDIDENARSYIAQLVDENKQLRDRIILALDERLKKKGQSKDLSTEEEYLIAYGQYLQSELEKQEKEANFSVRESWIVMKILDNARNINSKGEITCLHISSPEHVKGVTELLESFNVMVEKIKVSKEVILPIKETSNLKGIGELLQAMQIKVKPTIKKTSIELPYLLFFLDSDPIASPFDVCMAYDAGYNAVIPYENVNSKDAKKIVEDAVFSRGPKGVKRTTFFIGGKDIAIAEETAKVITKAMFPPFNASVIVDPAGAYTTAAAAVAKVQDVISSQKLGSLGDKTCAVFGTGSVGRIIAVLLTKLGCDVTIASLNPNRENGDEYAAELAEQLNTRYGARVQGFFAPTPEKKFELFKKAEVIFCAGTRGVQIIDKEMLQKVKILKVLADINAIPPLGVEGIKPHDDMREIMPGIYGVGALAIGRLKHEVEIEMLKEVRRIGKGTYNYNFAMELARKLLQKTIRPAALELTLSYANKK
jgi:methylene-tetrahydromethanopterin dehydrogenase